MSTRASIHTIIPDTKAEEVKAEALSVASMPKLLASGAMIFLPRKNAGLVAPGFRERYTVRTRRGEWDGVQGIFVWAEPK